MAVYSTSKNTDDQLEGGWFNTFSAKLLAMRYLVAS